MYDGDLEATESQSFYGPSNIDDLIIMNELETVSWSYISCMYIMYVSQLYLKNTNKYIQQIH